MFKQLRNKLLLVNMIIISALLFGSFGAIYIITYQNIHNSTSETLSHVIDFDRRMRVGMPPGGGVPPEAREGGRPQMLPEVRENMDRRADMMANFVMFIDGDGNIKDVQSPLEIDFEEESIDVEKIVSDKDGRGVISYSGGYWAYLVQEDNGSYRIGFVDYTSERQILFNLAIILLAVWVAALAAAFIISLNNANKSIRPVEESYNKQKQFVADASHELKTPLTTINTNVDVLLSHPESTIAEEEKWLGYIKSEAERMSKLTNDLLYLARLDHTEEKQSEDKCSISEVAENVILTMEAVAFEKNVSFSYDIEPGIEVKASEEQMKQVMMILLDNAIKYTPEDGRVDMVLKKEKNEAILKVRNTGEGINYEDMKHIFDRFYRADKSRARESGGYGLGLAIAKSICKGCGGDIAVESVVGEFAEFVVNLRIA